MKFLWIAALLISFLFTGCMSTSVGISTDFNETVDIINKKVPVLSASLLEEIAQGNIEGADIIHKFGASELSTSIHPITQSQVYQTPETAMQLEFVSSSIEDSFLGLGARQITIVGLDANWEEITQVINTSGTTPVTIPINLTRLYRWFVSSSGSYSNPLTAGHQGILTIQGIGGGILWSNIIIDPTPIGQSQIGVYTIPTGKVGYLLSKNVFTDTAKTADIYLFQRCGADDVTVPYSGVRKLVEREVGVQGGFTVNFQGGKGPFIGPCDIGFMGKVSVGTADVSVEFELVQLDVE